MMNRYIFLAPQKVTAGAGCSDGIAAEVKRLGLEKVYVITDAGVAKAGLAGSILSRLASAGIRAGMIGDVPSEPELKQVQEIFDRLREVECQLLIGIGGGSVMDVTKLLAVMKTNSLRLEDMLAADPIKNNGLPVMMVPTTAGTGSEATPNAIVTIPEQELKVGIVSNRMIPQFVFLDPLMTVGLPPQITASTGLDAFTHAIECYLSKKANPMSDILALQSIRLIYGSIRTAYSHGPDIEARHNMLLGSFLAGMCIASSGTTAVHALAYPLGGKYRIPHGVSNAMLLPYVMEVNRDAVIDRMADIATAMGLNTDTPDKTCISRQVVERIHNLTRELGIPESLKGFGIYKSDLDFLVGAAMKVTRLLDNNPKALSRGDIEGIYSKLL